MATQARTEGDHSRQRLRRLHVVDVEGLLTSPVPTQRANDIRHVVLAYRAAVHSGVCSRAVLGCPREWRFAVAAGWPDATVATLPGPRAGLAAVLQAVDICASTTAFDEVWLGSGEELLTPIATALREGGTRVVVVAPPCRLSEALRSQTDRYVPFLYTFQGEQAA